MAAAFRRLGVDARVGEVSGEYCPGAHSVNARGATKLISGAETELYDLTADPGELSNLAKTDSARTQEASVLVQGAGLVNVSAADRPLIFSGPQSPPFGYLGA